ncbi:hypothetical protein AQS8620_03351 [Aquimixticola soesokkakensis]|uniref:Uncharacterized protein n=1 Tax=Aquimixticola soesokkakensis TaxID=1519096 RepID=A0A1Y5TRQ2_9RHOB|nr:hypothetical protein AQS8620_03351 [Aquimixticola soesokkakensis]
MNPVEIEQAISDLARAPFDGAQFPFAFLEGFGRKPTEICEPACKIDPSIGVIGVQK